MADEIKQKIVLDGEKQYNQALKEAQRNLKTLRSELKAESAELGKNATEQQKNAVKAKNLQQQIKEQEQIVKTYREALEEVRQKYGDNEDAIARWEIKLNDARTALANMRNSLDDVGQGFEGIKEQSDTAVVAAKSVADAFADIGSLGDSIASGIEGAISGVVDTVRETISQVWSQIVDLAARSNNMVDLAGYWNTSVTTIQKYAGAVEFASANLEDLTGLVTKINSLDGNKIAELTGVSNENFEDQWEYAMAVMDAMSKMDTKTRNETGFAIFGKGATKAFDLLNDWKTVQENLDKFDPSKGGYGLTEEEVQTMSDLYDKVNGLLASWQKLQDMATVKLFGSLALDLTGNAQAILDALLKYFNAEDDAEREAALQEMEKNIIEAFERIKKAIEDGLAVLRKLGEDMQKSNDPAIQAIGNVITGLVSALEWLTEDNMQHVVDALKLLAAFWLTGEGLKMAGKVASFASNIAVIQGFKGLTFGAGAAGAAGTGTAGAAGAAAGGHLGIFAGIRSMVSATLPVVLAEAAVIAAAVTPAVLAQMENQKNWQAQQEEELAAANRAAERGDKATADFVNRGALAKGPNRNADGSYAKDWTGLFLSMNPNDDLTNLTMGLKNRSDQQKAELYNMLMAYAPETAGSNTWELLQRKWNQNDLSGVEETELLQSVMKAMVMWSDSSEGRKAAQERDAEARRAWWAQNESETVDLSEYTKEEMNAALQDWWDAWKMNDQNPNEENAMEEENAFAWFQEVFGDAWGDVYDSVMQHLDEVEDQTGLDDIPSNWWQTQQSTYTQLTNMPKEVEGAAERGIAKGMSGVGLYMDGSKVGQMVAPYVSQYMAFDVMD